MKSVIAQYSMGNGYSGGLANSCVKRGEIAGVEERATPPARDAR